MRHLTFGFVGLAAAYLTVSLVLAGEVKSDTPVTVLGADDVILHLPVSPSVERIVADLHTELETTAESATDTRVAEALRRVNADDELLRRVAASPAEMFDNGEAAATATAVYDVQLGSERVVVTVITVELVPAYGSTAASREHEDGHALINLAVARRCAGDALVAGVGSGLQGQALIDRIVSSISASGDPVHDAYHRYVRGARYGQHIRLAEQALVDTPGC